jgi:ABC-type methionine transport system permease subunit
MDILPALAAFFTIYLGIYTFAAHKENKKMRFSILSFLTALFGSISFWFLIIILAHNT